MLSYLGGVWVVMHGGETVLFDVVEGGHKGSATVLATSVSVLLITSTIVQLLRGEGSDSVTSNGPVTFNGGSGGKVHASTARSLVLDGTNLVASTERVHDPAVGVHGLVGDRVVQVGGSGPVAGGLSQDFVQGSVGQRVQSHGERGFAVQCFQVVFQNHFDVLVEQFPSVALFDGVVVQPLVLQFELIEQLVQCTLILQQFL